MVRLNARALAVTAALLITPAAAGCGYNTIPTKQERAEAAWADVQSQYQRRADLVPNLVATVQGAAIQERTTVTDVINARARATSVNVSADDLDNPQAFQQYQEAQGQLSGALSRLLVTVEAYPQLQANQNFLTLQSQLEGTENRIQIAAPRLQRGRSRLQHHPAHLPAGDLGQDPAWRLQADANCSQPPPPPSRRPQVNFNLNAPPSNASAPGGGAPAVAPGSTPPAQ